MTDLPSYRSLTVRVESSTGDRRHNRLADYSRLSFLTDGLPSSCKALYLEQGKEPVHFFLGSYLSYATEESRSGDRDSSIRNAAVRNDNRDCPDSAVFDQLPEVFYVGVLVILRRPRRRISMKVLSRFFTRIK